MKTTISAVEARKNFGRFLNVVELTGAELTIERAGKPIARLVGVHGVGAKREGGKLDFRTCRGLGHELWRTVDAAEYVAKERSSWG